ncbi:MAG: hypothetical protein K2N87_20395 [Eubacterium sp.]|nr:hypothetical protein [Eubacterium sp.]
MNQIITIQTNHPKRIPHGWILYTAGDSSLNPHYIRLYENACEKRGMSVWLGMYEPSLLCDEGALQRLRTLLVCEAPAFVINRTRDYRLAELLEAMGICVYNNSRVARLGNDKAQAYRYMIQRGIPVMPVLYGLEEPPRWYPAVAKSCDGHGGTQVYLIRDKAMWEKWKAQMLKEAAVCTGQLKQYVIQQAASDLGKDVRAYLVGGRIAAAVLRTSETDFRSNYCLGGSVELYRLSAHERELVQRAAAGLSIGMAGIDFLFHHGTMVFNEIEDMVGARGLYSLTDYDIVDEYIGYIQEEWEHGAEKSKDL